VKFNEAVAEVLKVFPNATFDEDNDGQIIIYTDKRLDPRERLVDFDLDELGEANV
jgi:hypothetical protein